MADIASVMRMTSWLRAKTSHIIDFDDEFIYATLIHRGVTDDETTVADVDERTRDLSLGNLY